MAIPEKPESRAEMYLNRIASGSGTIPAKPESRLEQYLEVIANNGGGGGGSGGGGVGIVNVTFVSSKGEYNVATFTPIVVDGSTFLSSEFVVGDESGPVTIGILKLGAGPVRIKLGHDPAITMGHIDTSVLPQVSGDATLDMSTGEWIINGDCTLTVVGQV